MQTTLVNCIFCSCSALLLKSYSPVQTTLVNYTTLHYTTLLLKSYVQCNICAVQYMYCRAACAVQPAEQCAQCAEEFLQCRAMCRGMCADQFVLNVQCSTFRGMCAMCRAMCSEECVPMQCNLQLSSQLVNLLLLDWTRSSQLRNIANLSPPKIFFPMFVFGRNFNVFTCSSTTVLLPNTHISCCNYKLMWRQFWRGTPSWSFVFLPFLEQKDITGCNQWSFHECDNHKFSSLLW